jgi:hypothetical protein
VEEEEEEEEAHSQEEEHSHCVWRRWRRHALKSKPL